VKYKALWRYSETGLFEDQKMPDHTFEASNSLAAWDHVEKKLIHKIDIFNTENRHHPLIRSYRKMKANSEYIDWFEIKLEMIDGN
jgi:hypothetical protein